MRPFALLTPRGQGRRLRAMAVRALDAYALDVRAVRLVANHLNAICRVDTRDGRTYALRVSHPTWHSETDLRSELAWLRALAAETEIGAPEPIAARDGALYGNVALDGIPEPRRCALFSWIPGPDLANHLTPARLVQLGALAADLHTHAARFQAPADFTQRQMNRVYARGEADVLFAPESAAHFTAGSRRVFAETRARVAATLAALYADPRGRRVIHNDLNQDNVKLARGRLRPLDFEDAILGYPVQDIAMTFADLLYYTPVGEAEYQDLCGRFEAGYRSRAAWPADGPEQVDTLIAGRQLWRANYVARFAPAEAGEFNAWLAPRLERFLQTGALGK
jgi:Ser/Thr protein kinase RdoA (MazF antagonist)